ncbi:hypothetical protein ACXPWS_15740 [Mycobacterium sp. BMJ-28]
MITRAAAINVEIVARDIDQPAAKAPELLADHDIVVADRDERDTATWGHRFTTTFLMREPLDLVLR